MGIKQIPVLKWVEFLKAQGLVLKRQNGGHSMYNTPEGTEDLRANITFQHHKKNVPDFIIKNGLETLKITTQEFEKIFTLRKMCCVEDIREDEEAPENCYFIEYKNQEGTDMHIISAFDSIHARNKFYNEMGYDSVILSIIEDVG